jgi:hypothetical protein
MLRARPFLPALLVICSLLALRRSRGIVLCVGADGPIAFEPVHDPSHGASAAGRAGTRPARGQGRSRARLRPAVVRPQSCAGMAQMVLVRRLSWLNQNR